MTQNTLPWQAELKQAITSKSDLLRHLKLPTPQHFEADPAFKLRVPWPFVRRMHSGNPQDPLLLQVLPQAREDDDSPGYTQDPLQERQTNPETGVIHKYAGRALLILSGGCAINCRYCFRRHFNYHENTTPLKSDGPAYQYLKNNTSIKEVILSGGDPLLYDDDQLSRVIKTLEGLDHIKRLRIHTRLPIVIPQRITSAFTDLLRHTRFHATLVVHCNHPQELDTHTAHAFDQIRSANIHLLNQSVLLKGINDCSETLIELSETLFEQGVLPYYLHTLDPVQGSAHFDISPKVIHELALDLLKHCPGYLVPKIVSDHPKTAYKRPWAYNTLKDTIEHCDG
jgi:L-lysine 2,3-aminomutase